MTEDERVEEEEAAAREILGSVLDQPNVRLERQIGGLSNCVFEAASSDGPVILRMGKGENKVAAFRREHLAIERASEVGVPVPQVIAQGELGAWAYLIAHKAAGAPATDHPQRLDILRDLARLAATGIHRIATTGFGSDFSFEGNCADGWGWRSWLEQELKAGERLEQLRAHGIISDEQHRTFHQSLEAMADWTGPSILNHGDLRLKNVLVDGDGRITALIDWEWCISSMGPHWDLSIALHDLSIDQKEAFIDGYGLTPEEVSEFSPFWRLCNALNYAPELERIVGENDDEALDRLRNRFSGSLDLYAEPDCPN